MIFKATKINRVLIIHIEAISDKRGFLQESCRVYTLVQTGIGP